MGEPLASSLEAERQWLLAARKQLVLDALEHAKHCIKDERPEFLLKAIEMAERQVAFWVIPQANEVSGSP